MGDPYAEFGGSATQQADPYAEFGGQRGLPSPNPMGLANRELAKYGLSVRPPSPPPIDMKPYGGTVTQVLDAAGARFADLASAGAEPLKHGMVGQGGQLQFPPDLLQQLDAVPRQGFNDPKWKAETQRIIGEYYKAHPEAEDPTAGVSPSRTATEVSPIAVERFASGDVKGGVGETITNLATLKAGSRSLNKPTSVSAQTPAAYIRSKVGQRIVRIEGVDMPVLAGEAEGGAPTSTAGKLQTSLKSAGIGENDFRAVEAKQQAAVKQVIKNVARKTTGLQTVTESPAGVVNEAASATFEQARPMYQALDASITHVPTVIDDLGTLTQKAVTKLRNSGVEIGNTYNPKQPFQSMQAIRSELLDQARTVAESDPAKSARLWEEAGKIDGDISEALQKSKVPGLYDNWRQANALWKRGYALRNVADAIDKSIEGTPVETQLNIPGEIGTRLPTIKAGTLVKQLNSLSKYGDLNVAFGDGYARSVRQVTEFLDRAQETPVGRLRFSSSAGSEAGLTFRMGLKLMQKIGGGRIARIMTDPKGARLVADVTNAATPEQVAARGAALGKYLNKDIYPMKQGPLTQHALPFEQRALPPASSIQPPSPLGRPILPEGQPGTPTEPVYEGEYLPESAPRSPRIARPAPPPETFRMPAPQRQALPPAGQRQLPRGATQLPAYGEDVAKMLSRTRGFTDVTEVMEAAKNGTITPAEAARITKLLKGKAAEITKRFARPEPPPE